MRIHLGDRGDAALIAQKHMNKLGTLLVEDGVFGRGCAAAVTHCREQLGLAAASEYDDELHGALVAQPEPLPSVDTTAVTFIAREEVGSREQYESRYPSPVFPGGESGMTIGVGYDLRFARSLRDDWGTLLPAAALTALQPWVGKQGTQEGVHSLSAVRVPWLAAWQVFTQRTLPGTLAQVQKAFPGQEGLSPLARGVLVSLVYNRGAAMEGDKRSEMRLIRDAISQGRHHEVPAALLTMRRLWPNLAGLQRRREREAELFRSSLSTAVR